MGTLFRRYRTTDGKRERLPKWYGRYLDATGRKRDVALSADKGVSRQQLVTLERDASDIRDGITSPYKPHAVKPIKTHLEDYQAELTARQRLPRYVADAGSKINSILNGCKIKRIGDLAELPIACWLDRQDFCPSTYNNYKTAIKGFANWLWQSHRTPEHKLAGLKSRNVNVDQRHQRRSLSPDELQTLLSTTRQSSNSTNGIDWQFNGKTRYILYLTAAYTGLRASELASLTLQSLDLTHSTITVEAQHTKNGQIAILPLPKYLADELTQYIDNNALPTDHLFGGSWAAKRRGSAMLRRDLKAAGIPYRDDSDKVFDFHALRGQYATALSRAEVHPRKAQELMRHSDINLTMRYYTDLHLADLAADVAKLEAPPQPKQDTA